MHPKKEYIIIVDKTDAPIGTMERGTLAYEDIYRVSALWITNSKGQVLLAQRNWSEKHDPGKWGPAVAGTVEVGETYERNIYKEAMEEIGLTGVQFTLRPKQFCDDGLHRFFTQWFTARIDRDVKDFVIRKEEVEQIAWVDADTLLQELQATPSKYVPNASNWRRLLSI
jgi:isopentenyldiphosphate isomerase